MTQHTPGPWAVNPVCAQVDAFVDGKPLAVCQLLWPTDERSETETEANARLIAAAPDLLEMTELLERSLIYEIKNNEREGDDEGARLKTYTLMLVRAALAKARMS